MCVSMSQPQIYFHRCKLYSDVSEATTLRPRPRAVTDEAEDKAEVEARTHEAKAEAKT